MLCFGLGTVPAMLSLGVARTLARPAVSAQLARAAGFLVIVFGLVTRLRAFDFLPHAGHMHH